MQSNKRIEATSDPHSRLILLKVMLDEIFGYNNSQNEIIWEYQTGGERKERFARKHDNIFFYTKSDKWTFNVDDIKDRRTEKSLARAQNPKGARISANDEFKNPINGWKGEKKWVNN